MATATALITVLDPENGGFPVPDAIVSLFDRTGLTYITFGRTNGGGVATFLVEPGTYKARLFKPGFSCTEATFTVTSMGGSFDLELPSISTAPSPSPDTCRLFADFFSLEGLPIENFKVQVQVQWDPKATLGFGVVDPGRTFTSDSAGHLEFTAVRGARLMVTFINAPWSRELVVPDKAVENLLTALGTSTDAFQIVRS